jgi:polysaccharide biosynthesis/export protein
MIRSENTFDGLRAICVCLLLWPIVGAAQSPAAAPDSMILGPGDVVRITVFGQPDLTTVTQLGEGGTVTFPLIGNVQIGGRSVADAERSVASLLDSGGIVRNPQVSIFLEQRGEMLTSSVTILGQVARPGKYPLQSITTEGAGTLVELLAMAGGPAPDAADRLLVIREQGPSQERIEMDLIQLLRQGQFEQNIVLRDKDVVLIPPMDVFYIYGAVGSPGRYRLERDMTVMQALSVAGGLTERGSDNRIALMRRREDGRVGSANVRIGDPLEAGDVLYVEESRF